MADARPFRGLRYNSDQVPDLSAVFSPPYDVISHSLGRDLRNRSPYNVVRLELPQDKPGDTAESNRHAHAAALFHQWLQEKVLVPEPLPAMYLVEQEYKHNGSTKRSRALIAAVRLEEFEKGIVMPHESTTSAPKVDRLALMKAAGANFSPIMALYRDRSNSIAGLLASVRQGQPSISGQLGITAWVITRPDILAGLHEAVLRLRLYIADGHHRYETALQYRNDLDASEGPLSADAAARFMMMTLTSMDDPGLLVLPYHRVLGGLTADEVTILKRSLDGAFHIESMELPRGSADAVAKSIEERLVSQPKDKVAVATFGLEPSRVHLLTLRESRAPAPRSPALEKCDMWILHQKGIRLALGPERESATINFVHDSKDAIERVLDGKGQVAFLLRPLPLELFAEVVDKGERLPPKSTYFYPKMPAGVVINHLVGDLPVL